MRNVGGESLIDVERNRRSRRFGLLPRRAMSVEVVRRLGIPPKERGSATNGTCPDIFELSDGNFAVIGTDMTAELEGKLPADAGLADYERIVVVSRATVVAARKDIPSS
jgi:hypothetical protein